MDQQSTAFPDAAPSLDRLGPRQIECLMLVHEGLTSKEIALRLGVSPSTVDNHISSAMAILNTESRKSAAKTVAALQAADSGVPAYYDASMIGENGMTTGKTKGSNGMSALFHLPPIGGRGNALSRQARAFHIVQIAMLVITSVLAIALTISGLVHLFNR